MESTKKTKLHVKVFIAQHLMAVSIGAFVFFLLAGYLFLFAPEQKRIRQANVSQSLEEERRVKAVYLDSLEVLLAKYEEIDPADIERLKTLAPSGDDIPALLAMFEAAALRSDVSLLSINFAKGDADGAVGDLKDIRTININLNIANASYTRFKLFLEALETNLRLFDIRSMDLNPGSANYVLSIRAYVRK